ncbi:MAG: translocation/assembly module TamB domain-containing protein, partial [Pseudomonadota bacterium]|nr:translocation/assembly module TamB domain-containing protein [Pseudomonadota bacterium]
AGRALGYEISCGSVEGDLLDSFRCRNLTLSDAKGPFFGAQDFALDWQALAFFGNKLALTRVAISDARLTRLPQSQPAPPEASWLPSIEIEIGALALRHFDLALSAAPAACLNIGGNGHAGPKGFETALKVVRCAPGEGAMTFAGRYDAASHVLSLRAEGADNGAVAAALTGVRKAGRTRLSLAGSGPLPAFSGRFVVAVENLGDANATFRAHGFNATHVDAAFDLAPALKPHWLPEATGTLAADLARGAEGTVTFDGTLHGSGAALAANGSLRGNTGSASVKLTLTKPGAFGPGISAALGPTPLLTAKIASDNGTYKADSFALQTAVAAVSGAAILMKDGALTAHVETSRGDAAALSALLGQRLSGSFALQAAISGQVSAPAIRLSTKARALTIGGQAIKDAALTLDVRKAAQWSGQVELSAHSPAGAIALDAQLQALADGWRARIAKGSLGTARLAGVLNNQSGKYTGAIALSGDVLKPVGFLLGRDMHGTGTVALNGTGKALQLSIDLSHVAAGSLKDARIEARALTPSVDARGTVSLSVADGANTLVAAGDMMLKPMDARLAKLNGVWGGMKIALARPAEFRMANGAFTLQPSSLSIGGGTLSLAAQGGKGALKASAHMKDMPAATVAALLTSAKATGTLDVDVSADMTPQTTSADLRFAGRQLAFMHRGKAVSPADIALSAHWNGQVIALNGTLTGLAGEPATLTAQLPVQRVAGGLAPVLVPHGAVSAALRAQMRAERLFALMPVAEQSLSGALSAALDVHGEIGAPVLSGRIALANGRFENFETGTTLEKLEVSLTAAGTSKAAFSLSATDGNSGKISGRGEFSLALLQGIGVGSLTGHADIALDKAELLRTDQIQAGASGKLGLDLQVDGPPKISGVLKTTTVRVDIEAAMPPDVPEIQVAEINGPPRAEPSRPEVPSMFAQAPLDVAISMPNRVYVSGHGLDSEWYGKLAIGGTVGNPQVQGKLDLVRGQAELIGKVFTLQSGRVTADADAKGGATVDLNAQNTSSDLTVTVTANGPVADPEIAWSSSPALPKDEILSRLLFGTSTPHLSAFQALQLAQLSGQLGSLGTLMGGGGILTFARRLTGLDVLRVETPSDTSGTGAAITAGKYLSDKVYVGVKQGTNVTAGSAQVEVKIAPHITLNAEAGANAQGSVGATWKWDY